MADNVTHPSHYTQGKVECIDAIEAAVTGLSGMDAVCTAQVIKYMWRWRHKKTAIIAKNRTNWRQQRLMEFSAQELRAELRRRNKEYKRQEKQDDCTDGICKL